MLWVASFVSAQLWACSCSTSWSPCLQMTGSKLVFVGRVLVDSGPLLRTRPARVSVEERLLNVPEDLREVGVNPSVGSNCHLPLKRDVRYVIFAYRGEGSSEMLFTSLCSGTFGVAGNEYILDALRSQSRGSPAHLVGRVLRNSGGLVPEGGVPGATVSVASDSARYEAVTDAFGKYQIRGLEPGRYRFEVSKAGYAPDL